MTKEDAIAALGGTQATLAEHLGMAQASVSLWKTYPPPLRQLQIEALTAGALRAEPECDKFRVPMRPDTTLPASAPADQADAERAAA